MILALEIVVAVAVLVGIVVAVTHGEARGTELDDVDVDRRDIGLPAGRLLRADDIGGLRFRAVSGLRGGLRGYRFGDVDAAMAKVEETLRAHESRSAPVPTAGSEQPRRVDDSAGSRLAAPPPVSGGQQAAARAGDADRPAGSAE